LETHATITMDRTPIYAQWTWGSTRRRIFRRRCLTIEYSLRLALQNKPNSDASPGRKIAQSKPTRVGVLAVLCVLRRTCNHRHPQLRRSMTQVTRGHFRRVIAENGGHNRLIRQKFYRKANTIQVHDT